MEQRTFSSPNATILIDNKKAGYIQSINWSENYNRVEVRGLGSAYASEAPLVSAGGTWQCGSMFLDWNSSGMKEFLNRKGLTTKQFIDTVSLAQFPFTIAVYKKTVVNKDDGNRLVTESDDTGEKFVFLQDCLTDSQSWSISEGGIASLNTTGRFLKPMIIQ